MCEVKFKLRSLFLLFHSPFTSEFRVQDLFYLKKIYTRFKETAVFSISVINKGFVYPKINIKIERNPVVLDFQLCMLIVMKSSCRTSQPKQTFLVALS